MKKLLKDKSGSPPILFIGVLYLMLLFSFLIIEIGGMIEQSEYAHALLQRCCNNAVEKNILDEYRADRVLKMDTIKAASDFRKFAQEDLNSKYQLVIESIDCTSMPPSMTVTGTVTFSSIFSPLGVDGITVGFSVQATDYDLD